MILKPSLRIMLLLIAISVSAVILYLSGVGECFTLDMLKIHKETLKSFVDYHPFGAPFVYIVLFTLMIVCVIPLSPLFTIAAGFLFGGFSGGLYTILGGVIGAVGLMLVVRYFLRDTLAKQKNKTFGKFQTELHNYGGRYLLSLVFLPITPFSVIATLAGLSDIAAFRFAMVVFIGMIPGTFIYSYAGQKLGELESVGQIMSPLFIGLFVALGIMSILPVALLKIKKRKDGKSH